MKVHNNILFLLFIGFLLVQSNVHCQERYLKMTHLHKNKVEELHGGQHVRIQTYEDQFFRGKLNFANDTMITIGKFFIPLENIKEVKRINRNQQIAGAGGLLVTGLAEAFLVSKLAKSDSWHGRVLISIGIVVVPILPGTMGIALILVHKRYDLTDDWSVEMINQSES